MYTLFFRTLITYAVLIGVVRLMGKRQIGELENSEFVITMLLSELAALPIADSTIPLVYSVLPIIVLLSLEVIISFAFMKNRTAKRLIGGKPSVIISKGRLCLKEMKKVRINLDELLSQLRLKNISDISEVEYAFIEENGQISVFPKAKNKNLTPGDMSLDVKEKGLAHPLIVDGQISDFNLSLISKDKKWLEKQLKKEKTELKDVMLYTVDDAGNTNIIKNTEEK